VKIGLKSRGRIYARPRYYLQNRNYTHKQIESLTHIGEDNETLTLIWMDKHITHYITIATDENTSWTQHYHSHTTRDTPHGFLVRNAKFAQNCEVTTELFRRHIQGVGFKSFAGTRLTDTQAGLA